jgi:hypothetical protein
VKKKKKKKKKNLGSCSTRARAVSKLSSISTWARFEYFLFYFLKCKW